MGGLWLNTLPAWLFGTLVVLVPLQLRRRWVHAVRDRRGLPGRRPPRDRLQPVPGPLLHRRGRLLPIRLALGASVVVAIAFAVLRGPYAVALLAVLAAIAFGAFYTPGMALVSDRAEAAGLSQALGFGIMNTAWAFGHERRSARRHESPTRRATRSDLLAAGLCLVTLLATETVEHHDTSSGR